MFGIGCHSALPATYADTGVNLESCSPIRINEFDRPRPLPFTSVEPGICINAEWPEQIRQVHDQREGRKGLQRATHQTAVRWVGDHSRIHSIEQHLTRRQWRSWPAEGWLSIPRLDSDVAGEKVSVRGRVAGQPSGLERSSSQDRGGAHEQRGGVNDSMIGGRQGAVESVTDFNAWSCRSDTHED